MNVQKVTCLTLPLKPRPPRHAHKLWIGSSQQKDTGESSSQSDRAQRHYCVDGTEGYRRIEQPIESSPATLLVDCADRRGQRANTCKDKKTKLVAGTASASLAFLLRLVLVPVLSALAACYSPST